jgi:hypothetical protein
LSIGVPAAIAVLYLVGTLGRARQKLLWHDEIFTVILAALEPSQLWTALRGGVDLNPPGFYLLTQAGQAAFGGGPTAARLPAIGGVLVAAACVAVFVRRRAGAVAGWSATLLLLCTDAYRYAYEARPYGALLGMAGLAAVCWQAAASRRPRGSWLAGLWASLTGALACHYYAVLLFVPVAAGELVRLHRTRRADWPLWITVSSSTAPLVLFLPIIRGAGDYADLSFFSQPAAVTLITSIRLTVADLAVPLVVSLVVIAALAIPGGLDRTKDVPQSKGSIAHEWAFVTALVMLPLVAYALAALGTRALVGRYFLPWNLGLSMLLPFAIRRFAYDSTRVLAVLATVLFLWFGARQAASARGLLRPPPDFASVSPSLVTGTSGDLPIVIDHGHVYLQAVYYAPPALRSRIVRLDPPVGPGTRLDSASRAFYALRPWMPLQLSDFETFISRQRRFYTYDPAIHLTERLRREGGVVVLRGVDEHVQPYGMSRPGPCVLSEVTFGRAPAAAVGK